MKRSAWLLITATILVLTMFGVVQRVTLSQTLGNTEYQVTIAAAAHQAFGLYYPVTYMFQIPGSASNLSAQYRYRATDNWTPLNSKTATDRFNGENAVRFDYAAGMAYVSVAFTQNSDNLYLRVVDSQSQEVPLTYVGIPTYYDNRKAAVTISLDDWKGDNNADFNNAATILTPKSIHFTAAIITDIPTYTPDWSLVQHWVNSGYMEVGSHSRTHPCTDQDYMAYGYDYQVTGSKQDILANVTLPHPYVPTYVEPCGLESPAVRQAIISAGYLDTRGFNLPPVQNTFSAWGTDGSYQRALYSMDTWSWPWYTQDNTLLAQANSNFDAAYASGGIYHLVDHPWQGRWFAGSTLDSHSTYIANRTDVWYAAFGELYLYHYVQERGQVTVSPVGVSGTVVPPTATNTPLPPTATNTPLPPTSTPTLVPASTYSLWSVATVPTLGTVNDPNPVELGVKFRSDVSGYITGLRFYKGPNNTGTHVGHLWTASGALLAQATFTGETTTGWQTATLVSPVAITANTVYVASYHTDSGNYSMNQPYFTTGYYNSPLYAFGNSEVAGGNGVFTYGASAFPNQTYQSSNYWVDVIFSASTSTSTPPAPTSTPTPLATPSNTPVPPTPTPTPLSPTSTPTPLATPTNTPVPPTPTPTPLSPTSTLPPSVTPTGTPAPSRTPMPTRTPTASRTPKPTRTSVG